jgi:hypothetical protein
VAQQNIDKINPQRAYLPATTTGLMFQAEAMLLDLEKFLVERENVGWAFFARGGELVLRVSQNLFEMTPH